MKITIDTKSETVLVEDSENGEKTMGLFSKETFELISDLWVKTGWNQKYQYTFSWFGRPIIQLPEDMVRVQELIYKVKPDVIVETGIAHGGSLIFYASLCKAMDKGRVVGVDIEIRPHNRKAIEEHPLFSYITLIEGSSTDADIVAQVKRHIQPSDSVMVLLDSNHTKAHVLNELNAYAPLVTKGSYIVATDGIMEHLAGAPRTQPDWTWNNPKQAALEFTAAHPDFVIEEPDFPFNESSLTKRVTHWTSGYIKRIR
jgi:cephalosporin hydroxylase